MKAVLLALGSLYLLTQSPAGLPAQAAEMLPPGLPIDGQDRPVLLGATTVQAILAHRAIFRENLAKVKLTSELKARWKAVRRPLTLVAVFGSWCGDSHRQLPGLLALEAEPNPFIAVSYVGVNHDKAVPEGVWPKGCAPQAAVRVPTFFLFALQPGGSQKWVGSVVETPPREGQSMAEALVELVEAADKGPAR